MLGLAAIPFQVIAGIPAMVFGYFAIRQIHMDNQVQKGIVPWRGWLCNDSAGFCICKLWCTLGKQCQSQLHQQSQVFGSGYHGLP